MLRWRSSGSLLTAMRSYSYAHVMDVAYIHEGHSENSIAHQIVINNNEVKQKQPKEQQQQ